MRWYEHFARYNSTLISMKRRLKEPKRKSFHVLTIFPSLRDSKRQQTTEWRRKKKGKETERLRWNGIELKANDKKKIEYPKSWEDCTWKVSHTAPHSSHTKDEAFLHSHFVRFVLVVVVVSNSIWFLFLFFSFSHASLSIHLRIGRKVHNQLFISSFVVAIECDELWWADNWR